MQLFALFNILDICLTEEKLLSRLCELSCLCVCTTEGTRQMVEKLHEWVENDLESEKMKKRYRRYRSFVYVCLTIFD